MKKLSAFSLAEVLITLAIIGVIAVMTYPVLNTNIMKNTSAAGLARAINDLESANKLLIQQNNLRNLTDHAIVRNNTDSQGHFIGFRYFEALSSIMNFATDNSYTCYYYNGSNPTNYNNVYTAPNGISYILATNTGFKAIGSTTMNGYSGTCLPEVIVDINGAKKGPNKIGKDVFFIDIDSKGHVIPRGSKLQMAYRVDINDNWETNCIKQPGGPVNASYCAGAIADNGYKVLYY